MMTGRRNRALRAKILAKCLVVAAGWVAAATGADAQGAADRGAASQRPAAYDRSVAAGYGRSTIAASRGSYSALDFNSFSLEMSWRTRPASGGEKGGQGTGRGWQEMGEDRFSGGGETGQWIGRGWQEMGEDRFSGGEKGGQGTGRGWQERNGDEGEWYEAAYGWPTFSVGLIYNTLGDVTFIDPLSGYSDMVAVYGGWTRELLSGRWLALSYDAALGASYSQRVYDPVLNRANWFYSSKVLFYASGGAHLSWRLADRLDLETGVHFRHSSSARLAYPNGGLNYVTGDVSARYWIDRRSDQSPRRGAPSAQRPQATGWSTEVYVGGGVHACAAEWLAILNTRSNEEAAQTHLRRWPMASIGIDAIYRCGGRLALGLSAEAFYASNSEALRWADSVLYSPEEIEAGHGYGALSAGLGAVQEVFYKNIALYLKEGCYLVRRTGVHGYHGPIYEKAGFRWYPPALSPFFLTAAIKVHKFKADYLDLSVGVRF